MGRILKTKKTNKTGFTLIELILVIAIIGVLSTIVIARMGEVRQRSIDAQKIVNLQSLNNSTQVYMLGRPNHAPPLVESLGSSVSTIDIGAQWDDLGMALGIGSMPHGLTYPNNFSILDFYWYAASYTSPLSVQYNGFCVVLGPFSYVYLVNLHNLSKGGLVPQSNFFVLGGGTSIQVVQPLCT